MHSANRAKMRLRSALEAAEKSASPLTQPRRGRDATVFAFGSSISGPKAVAISEKPRTKSLDRKSTLKKAQQRDYSPAGSARIAARSSSSGLKDHLHHNEGSDSGLSGFEVESKKSPDITVSSSMVDSGRRSQSFEMLSDDLRSMTLSTPSSPSPRPPKIRGHVHFKSLESQELSQAEIVRNMVSTSAAGADPPGTLRKSTSIPVHLTVSGGNEVALPPRLRPYNNYDSDFHHDSDCASIKQSWAGSVQSLTRSRASPAPPATPLGETVSSLQKKKIRINNGYSSSLPRSSSAREGFYNGKSSPVPRSRSSASISGHFDTPRSTRPPSVASSAGSSRRPASSRAKPKVLNASMSIWEIQKELKRGEMVQGVLSLGPPIRTSFGSRIQEEETCICAPVVIGGKNGHMEWKRM